MPLVAILGAVTADQIESGHRRGPRRRRRRAVLDAAGSDRRAHGSCDRLWLAVLFGFSTQILWVTTRGGVWHTGHLIATILTFACLDRAVRPPARVAHRPVRRVRVPDPRAARLRDPVLRADARCAAARRTARSSAATSRRSAPVAARGSGSGSACCRRSSFFFAYNQVRFGTPLESGYALASLPPFLEATAGARPVLAGPRPDEPRLLPAPSAAVDRRVPVLQARRARDVGPDHEPGPAVRGPGRLARPRAWWLLGATVAVLIPTLLYYGGGWLQYGYRYFLDSVPFVIALCGLAAVQRGWVGTGWRR